MAQQRSYQSALLQGILHGAIRQQELLMVERIEQPVDEEGNYEQFLIVITFSGQKIRVTVQDEEESGYHRSEEDGAVGQAPGEQGEAPG